MLLLPAAVCDPLPPNVTSGYTISMGGLIPSGGTNLNVPSMQLAAAGNESAVFYAEGLLFAGTLTVTFPNTNPYGVPVFVDVVNGSTQTGASLGAHVKILGVIGGGSRVSIKGGSFTFVSSFLQISAELAIVGASLMEVVGVSCSASTIVTSGVTSASFISAVAPIIVSNRSTFSISHIAIGAFSANIQTELSLSMLNATSAIDIFGSSTLSIDTATIEMQHVVAKGNLGVYVMYTSSSIAVSNNSTLSIHNSSAEVDDVIVSGTFSSAMVMMMAIGSFTISYGSSMSLSCATLGVRGVSVTQSWPLYVMSVYSTLIMSNSSTLSISNITRSFERGDCEEQLGLFRTAHRP